MEDLSGELRRAISNQKLVQKLIMVCLLILMMDWRKKT